MHISRSIPAGGHNINATISEFSQTYFKIRKMEHFKDFFVTLKNTKFLETQRATISAWNFENAKKNLENSLFSMKEIENDAKNKTHESFHKQFYHAMNSTWHW